MSTLDTPEAIAAEAAWHDAQLAYAVAQEAVQIRRCRATLDARATAATEWDQAREAYKLITGQEEGKP